MEGSKETSPMGIQLRMLAGAVISFGKEVLDKFRSCLDAESYKVESDLVHTKLPALPDEPPEFVKHARRDNLRSSSPPPKRQLNSAEFGKRARRDSIRPSSPPRGCIPRKALRK